MSPASGQYVADLHLHSPYAYATSKNLTLENLSSWAALKGIDLLATGDFTHPVWFEELRQKLTSVEHGLYRLAGAASNEPRFILGTEVNCVYQQGGRQRRLHILLLAPDLDTVARLNQALSRSNGGRQNGLSEDGRPTLNLSARDLVALALEASPECIIIPAHVWTPWYGVFGSKSGFDHLEECFQDLTPQIHAVETGLSSDPAMNWAIPELADRSIVSFSDAHSLPKLGREATVFEGPFSYSGLAEALARQRIAYTVEFYPEEGKYHYSGHRKCGIRQSSQETLRQGIRCPVCRRPLTLGVLHRVLELSALTQQPASQSREVGGDGVSRGTDGFIRSPGGRPPFIRLVPLQEIIAETLGVGPASQRVQQEYQRIVKGLGNELHALVHARAADLERAAGERLAQAVLKARVGDVQVDPGYDGVYGKVHVWPEGGTPEPSEPAQPRLAGL